MIIHFVAYPNSKDYLLLQSFYKVFGITWYEADIEDQSDLKVPEEDQLGGYRSAGEPWRTFFDRHHSSKNSIFFARTRRLPQDDIPFVYVSRHPASVMMDSATTRHEVESQDFSTALLREILGIGEHPDWSAHYIDWKGHKEKATGYFLRLEDFCADPLRTLVKIAVRLHLPKPQKFEDCHCELPPDRLADFENTDPAIKTLLFALHGETMTELGYQPISSQSGEKLLEEVPPEILGRAISLLRNESNISKKKSDGVQAMAAYIASLERQYKQETEALIDRINKLTKVNPT